MKSLLVSYIMIKEVIPLFFELENHIEGIVGVDYIEWQEQACNVMPRGYSAIAFRISGSGSIQYNDKKIFVDTNDVLYLPQNIGYTAEYSDTKLIVIHFITATTDTTAEVFSFVNTEKIYKLFLEALDIWNSKNIGYKVLTLSVLYKILGTIYKKTQKHTLPGKFIKAISIINSNYKNNSLSIKDVCYEAQIGETHFRKLFSEYYKKTPITYINELRIESARNLISNGASIECAAYESGFNDPKYFARVVKKCLNCTPRDLKNYGK